MLKRVLLGLLVTVIALQAAVSYVSSVNGERDTMQHAAAAVGTAFELSADPALADPDVAYASLRAAAADTTVNVFRTVLGYDANDAPLVTQYALLSAPTKIFRAFPLASGTPLTPEQTASTDDFMSTVDSGAAQQTAVIRELPGGVTVQVRPLHAAFDSVPTAGTYYVECSQPSSCDAFLAELAAQLNARAGGEAFSADSFTQSHQSVPGLQNNTFAILLAITYALVIFVVILVIYRQLYEAKRAAVLRLHGFSVLATWFRISGLPIALTLVVSGAIAVGLSALVPGTSAALVIEIATGVARTGAVIVIASLLTCFYIEALRLAEAIKNRKDTKLLLVLSTVLKAIFATVLIVTGAGLFTQFEDARGQQAQLGSWHDAANYGVFYPTSVGNDLGEAQSSGAGPTPAEVFDLYPLLNARGALYVESSSFTPAALQQQLPPGAYRSLVVNPNFLAAYPLVDEAGVPVSIPETETAWVVLAPASLKGQRDQLEQFFTSQRSNVGQAESAVFGRPVSDAVAAQKVQIVWIADHQATFTFNPDIAPADGNRIADVVIQVMTTANSAGIDRANAVSGGIDAGLKVHLVDGGPTATLAGLQSDLRRMHLDDNLLHLVTLDDYAVVRLQYLEQGIVNILVVAAALLVVLFVLAIQNLTLVFERFSRRVVVRRVFGLGLVARYREFAVLFVGVSVLQLACALVLNAAGVSPFATGSTSATTSVFTVLGVWAVVFLIETAVSVAALSVIERRRVSSVLKGEF
jgi:putative ABC transport system permease protein